MITSFQLGNFKAFADAQNIPVKPITLIFGANSAGKSSIIHSLAFAHEAMRNGELDLFHTQLGGSSIDLGGFRQYIHRRQANRRMEWGVSLSTKEFTGRLKELFEPVGDVSVHVTIGMPLDDQENPIPNALPHVMSYDLEDFSSTILRMSRRPDNMMAIDMLPYKHPVWKRVISALLESFTTTGTVSDEDFVTLEESVGEIISNLRSPMGAFFPKGIKDLSTDNDPESHKMNFFTVSKGSRKEDLAKALKFFLPRTIDEMIQELNKALDTEISKIQYLGPLRSYPSRHLAFAEHEDINWYAGGGYAWDVVRRNREVRIKVNSWLSDSKKLSTPYELSIKSLLTIDDIDADYEKIIEEIEKAFVDGDQDRLGGSNEDGVDGDLFGTLYDVPNELKLKAFELANIHELVLIDRRTDTQVSHRDVGIGVSQVLPVLVAAYASEEKIIAIEQPEIHLHPALQAELADVIIDSALKEGGNTFVLETHSEHFILRILRRIREKHQGVDGAIDIKPEDVSVLYVKTGKNGSEVIDIPITEDGDFEYDWPDGFFEERDEELFY